MKSQLSQPSTLPSSSRRSSQGWSRIVIATLICLLLAASCQFVVAQENYLVVTSDGVGSLYDLATNTFIESIKGNPLTYNVATGANNRLAFEVGGIQYVSVVDTTIAREVTRIRGVNAPSIAMTTDGKFLLLGDYSFFLDIIDTAQLQVVRKVDLRSILSGFAPGAIVPVANKAYVFPRSVVSNPKVAVVDLTNYSISSITLPDGSISKKGAAVTPDGSTVVAIENESSDHKSHVLLISTATNTIVADIPQTKNYSVQAFVVTSNGSDPNKIFGYVSSSSDVVAVDLRTNSPTYGQILPATDVMLGGSILAYTMAINSDGSRLILAGYTYVPDSPNVNVIDTAKMFTDPVHALIAQVTVDGGIYALAVCTGFFPSTPPNTAPTVSGVSGDITNDADHQIDVTGGNFQPGALVRIGSMDPLPATVNGSNSLTVTVPANAPAGKALDIIVTNPQVNDPPDQQNQSGLLAGKVNILLNPKFQPTTQFATIGLDSSFSVYDIGQRTMLNVQTAQSGNSLNWPAFNVDGKGLYLSASESYGSSPYAALPVNLANNMVGNPIYLPQNAYLIFGYQQSLAASRDPGTGNPVVNVPWYDDQYQDLHISVIDSNSASQKFNTIIRTFDAGINDPNRGVTLYAMAISPDGKFAYLWYDDSTGIYFGIMNLSTGSFTHVTADSLGVVYPPWQISISPDGKSLLSATYFGDRTRIRVIDISNPTHPKPLTLITPIPIPGRGFPYVANYQVVGDKLYAIDLNGIVVVFNFDRQKGDFRERGYFATPNKNLYWSGFALSTDGAYMYVSDDLNDQISVLDTSKFLTGKAPLLTNVRAPYGPYTMDISPVPPPMKAATAKHSGGQRGMVQPQRANGAGVESQ